MERRLAINKLDRYTPYSKQLDFHAAGANYRERLFMAGNQLGKTIAGGFEAAMHATGAYPDWWSGRRFDCATYGWAAGVTGESTRDNPQRILMGQPGEWGTGAIPEKYIDDIVSARGTPNLLDSAVINHVSGKKSRINFKSYIQGREKWQGPTLHWVWYDEEPPADIYSEGLTRTNATDGIVWMTFTPLIGMSEVVMRFLQDDTGARHVTQMTIDDAPHYSVEQRERIVASYAPHEREARAKGIPVLGSGRIFPIAEETISVQAFDIPKHWTQIAGMDFGYDHPTAAARLAWDRDNDCVYVINCYRVREASPVIHSAALRSWGDWLLFAWPHDGFQHDKGGSCEQLMAQYKAHGIKMLPEQAKFPDGTNGVEAGLMDMLDRMQTGRFKVFNHLNDWFEEFRLYHRKDGKIVKQRDDILSATRYGLMCLRYATVAKPKFNYSQLYD